MSDSETHYAYLFEAKGLQSFIGESGRLVDIVGASDQIAWVAGSDEDDLLATLLCKFEDLTLSRRAGAAFCLHGTDVQTLQAFRDAWSLMMGMVMAGLPYVDVLTGPHESEKAARLAAYATQPGVRYNGTATLLPLARPGIKMATRTGMPASAFDFRGDGEVLTSTTADSRFVGRRISGAIQIPNDRLARRILKDAGDYSFPRHFLIKDAKPQNPAFPFRANTDDQRIGIVHADISGLGQVFMNVSERLNSADDIRKVAETIEACIEKAAHKASRCVLDAALCPASDPERWARHFGTTKKTVEPSNPKLLPMRPVLLGGDDITVIVRADLALRYAQDFLEALEIISRKKLKCLWDSMNLHDNLPCQCLTACAGIAIVGNSHPYVMANALAEGMCKAAKEGAKAERRADDGAVASAMTFAVVSVAVGEDFEVYRKREMMVEGVVQSAAPYVVGQMAGHCALTSASKLWAVRDAVAGLQGLQGFREALHGPVCGRAARLARAEEIASIDHKTAFNVYECATGRTSSPSMGSGMPSYTGLLADALELIDIAAVPPESS